MERVPTADATGKWLKHHSLIEMYGTKSINQTLLKRYLKCIDGPLILDIDASVINSYKLTAAYNN
ncbi:MAG TPA: hypothetical protein EYP79_02130 [Campylobacterales bacterium]|nr:hypothetical protein [Campylobacterales bacterium]